MAARLLVGNKKDPQSEDWGSFDVWTRRERRVSDGFPPGLLRIRMISPFGGISPGELLAHW